MIEGNLKFNSVSLSMGIPKSSHEQLKGMAEILDLDYKDLAKFLIVHSIYEMSNDCKAVLKDCIASYEKVKEANKCPPKRRVRRS